MSAPSAVERRTCESVRRGITLLGPPPPPRHLLFPRERAAPCRTGTPPRVPPRQKQPRLDIPAGAPRDAVHPLTREDVAAVHDEVVVEQHDVPLLHLDAVHLSHRGAVDLI